MNRKKLNKYNSDDSQFWKGKIPKRTSLKKQSSGKEDLQKDSSGNEHQKKDISEQVKLNKLLWTRKFREWTF